jgi:hypothetical protein
MGRVAEEETASPSPFAAERKPEDRKELHSFGFLITSFRKVPALHLDIAQNA